MSDFTKEFIPYELALRMKQLGFDEPCFGYYKAEYEDGINPLPVNLILEQNKASSNVFYKTSAPTFSQAFRWFREKYFLMFQIYYLRNGNHAVIIHSTTPEYMKLVDQLDLSGGCVAEVVDCYSEEEAELECLKKLIELVEEKSMWVKQSTQSEDE
jgi:hypothetical protein